MQNRSVQIDFLRVLGLALIVLAHVNPPFPLYQLRDFDVPLMVFLSGMGSSYQGGKESSGYASYVWKRFIRLIVPAWIFLTVFFVLMAVLHRVGASKFDYTPQIVLSSYLLWGGIGYVWILRIFFCIALAAPLLAGVLHRARGWKVLIGAVFLANEALAAAIGSLDETTVKTFLRDGVAPLFGYLGMYLLGAGHARLSRAERVGVALLGAALTLAIGGWHWLNFHRIIALDDAKYPPHGIYLAYAVAMSLAAMAATARLDQRRDGGAARLLHTLGANTIWIYLWHIPLVIVSGRFGGVPFWAKYAIVLGVATLTARVQTHLVHALLRAVTVSPERQRTITTILCS